MNRVQNTKMILWLIVGFAAAIGLNRFIFGLGATTNLTDKTPWGLWIGFDVMGGVALAAGGFVMTAIFYIIKREEFYPFVKPAVLTAFLGYMAVVFGLIFDLGLPWNIWHMIVFWNPSSPLFEVGWCVMLYSVVLLLEFSPVALEKHKRFAAAKNFLVKYRFLFVLLGIMLSTLHQSSLGSLFLIMQYKLHPLWYSEILPINFFLSAIALGLMMVSFESLASHWLYKRKAETNLLAKLGKIAVWVLLVYLIVKMVDIFLAGEASLIFNGSFESNLFITEMLISAIIPILLLGSRGIRNTNTGQWIASSLVVIGMVFNRLNVGGVTMLSVTGDSYVPSWMEVSISLGVVSSAILVFLFVIENFNVWNLRPVDPQAQPDTLPSFDYSSHAWLGVPNVASITKYSLAFIFAFSFGMAVIPAKQLHSKGILEIEVNRASGKEILFINGNRDDNLVSFPHEEHINRVGKENCNKCHHYVLPNYKSSNCWECHSSMYQRVDFFKHDWHSSASGANLKCFDCHMRGVTKNSSSAKQCTDCHPSYNFSEASGCGFEKYFTYSYADAMHNLCVTCHTEKSKELVDAKNLSLCSTCHKIEPPESIALNLNWQTTKSRFNNVVLPVTENIEED